MGMGNYAIKHKCEVDVYVEHTISVPDVVFELEGVDEGGEGDCVTQLEKDMADVNQKNVNDKGSVNHSFAEADEERNENIAQKDKAKGKQVVDVEEGDNDSDEEGVGHCVTQVEKDRAEEEMRENIAQYDKGKGKQNSDGDVGDNDSDEEGDDESDDEDHDMIFGDSEEERDMANDVDGWEGWDSDDPIGNVKKKLKHKKRGDKKKQKCMDMDQPNEGDMDYEIDEEGLESDDGSDVELEGMQRYCKYRAEDMCASFEFKLNMEFSSLKQFKDALMEHSIVNNKSVKWVKNNKTRARAVCKSKNICDFTCLCSKVGSSHTYRIKTLKGTHSCGLVYNNNNVKSSFVAKALVGRVKCSKQVSIKEVYHEMKSKYQCGVSRWKAYKARKIAKEVVQGDETGQYALLWRYIAELKRASRDNTCLLKLADNCVQVGAHPSDNDVQIGRTLVPRFGSFYMCLEGCRSGFLAGCRPFIGLDGCHLKTQYKGQLLTAIGRDANDQYFSLAFAVVEMETKESWHWFLTNLLGDIGSLETNRWIFISDQQKGLVPTFQELMEGVKHRYCLRHLYGNFKKKFGGGVLIRDLMMAASKATYYSAWEYHMAKIKDINEAAYEWLLAVPKRAWCKHAFSFYPKCDVVMNNMCESFNNAILEARDQPIISMFEWIRSYLMNRMTTLRMKWENYSGEVMPKPKKRLDREVKYSFNWDTLLSGNNKFEVVHLHNGERFVVDLQKESCSCNFWELVGIPCRHAIAALHASGQDPTVGVHRWYRKDTYAACYGHCISPINGQSAWPISSDTTILPPAYKRGPGRPKKLRRREPEEENATKARRYTTTYMCGRCRQEGHNARKCKNPPVDPKWEEKRQIKKKKAMADEGSSGHGESNDGEQLHV